MNAAIKNTSNRNFLNLDPAKNLDRFVWPHNFSIRLRMERFFLFGPSYNKVIVFSGGRGTGKSHLLEGLMIKLLEKDRHLSTFLLRSEASDEVKSNSELRDYMVGCDVLCVDDIDLIWSQKWIQQLLHQRSSLGKPTFITLTSGTVREQVLHDFGDRCEVGVELQVPDSKQIQGILSQSNSELSHSMRRKLLGYKYKNVSDVLDVLDGFKSRDLALN